MLRGRSPYWLLVAFALLLAAPPWVGTAFVVASAGVMAARVARSIAVRRGARARPPEDAIVLGTDRGGAPVWVSERELSGHGLILGASGSGKTTTLLTILTEQIARGRPVVVIDMKGSLDFARRLSDAATAAGRPFRMWSPDGPTHWNPLAHGNATELKDKLICTERFTEPHYQRAAERYLQTVLQVLQAAHPGQPPTLEQVVALMDRGRLRASLRGLPRPLTDRVNDYLAKLTPDQLSAVHGLQTRLAILTESHTGPYLAPGEGQTVDLRAALAGPEVVLFSLDSSRYGQLASQLGTLAVQDLISATGDRLQDRQQGRHLDQATIAIDECSGIRGDHAVALFVRCRESGVGVLAATQEMADLDRAGRGMRDQVLGNTALKLVLRQDVPASAQTVAQMAGTETAIEETRQVGGPPLSGYPPRRTQREVERFVVHPNEIKSLSTGDAVLISKLRGGKAQTIRVKPPGRSTQPPTGRTPERPGAERGI